VHLCCLIRTASTSGGVSLSKYSACVLRRNTSRRFWALSAALKGQSPASEYEMALLTAQNLEPYMCSLDASLDLDTVASRAP
jgi:hypothetical protein